MIFRRAKPEDAVAISGLILSFLNELTVDPNGGGAEEFLAAVCTEAEKSYILSDQYDYLIADIEGVIAGFIAMQHKMHVFHLFVSRQYQRQGLARALWQRARDAAGPHNVAREFTVNSSLLAVPVYERFGFERVSAPEQRNGISFVRMRCGADRLAAEKGQL
jgi:GNAT superfamily N-acetyltransferase